MASVSTNSSIDVTGTPLDITQDLPTSQYLKDCTYPHCQPAYSVVLANLRRFVLKRDCLPPNCQQSNVMYISNESRRGLTLTMAVLQALFSLVLSAIVA